MAPLTVTHFSRIAGFFNFPACYTGVWNNFPESKKKRVLSGICAPHHDRPLKRWRRLKVLRGSQTSFPSHPREISRASLRRWKNCVQERRTAGLLSTERLWVPGGGLWRGMGPSNFRRVTRTKKTYNVPESWDLKSRHNQKTPARGSFVCYFVVMTWEKISGCFAAIAASTLRSSSMFAFLSWSMSLE